MRIGILCDGATLKRWQYEAVERIAEANEIYLLEAKGERPASRKPVRHGAYYLLNLAAIRGPLTAARPFPDDAIGIRDRISFEVAYEKSWAVLPDEVIAFARKQRLDAIVKFSLNLLRIPSDDVLPVPILSYHHGDPRSFRGRPAGYYEIESGSNHLGQIVQVLSNRLDAGEVLAATQTPVFPHSYRRTLREAYAMSPHLLPQALDALRSGTRIDWAPTGPNYRLPTNRSVFRFAGARLAHTSKRLLYGAFGEKRWAVSTVRLGPGEDPFEVLTSDADERWSTPAIPRDYSFLADPFILNNGALVVEALERRSGTGALLRLHAGEAVQLVHASAGHLSYPAVIEQGGEEWLLPETAGWAPPTFFAIEGDRLVERRRLDIDASRLLDPTPFELDGRVYLFANRAEEGASILRLWHAPSLDARFEEHPASPVRVSVRGSRMAGGIIAHGGRLRRIGQDRRKAYGDGVIVFDVDELDAEIYRESEHRAIAFKDVSGPHTLNVRDDMLAFDWYRERFSMLAGARRLAGRLNRKR